MKTSIGYSVFLFLFVFVLLPHIVQAQQWQLQTTLEGSPPTQSIKAVNQDVVWICSGDGFVYRTTDSGHNWHRKTQVPSNNIPFVITAIDSLTAFACGSGPNFSGNASLYRTTDGGQSWEDVYTAIDGFWNMIHFFDSQNGIAQSDPVSGSNVFLIIRTSDGGTTWTPISNPPVPNEDEFGWTNSFQFYDNMHGWFGTAGSNSGRVFRTTDGGETWTGYSAGNTSGILGSVNFVSPMIGVRTSDRIPFLTRTTDGGLTWSPVSDIPVSDVQLMQGGTVASTSKSSQIWIYGEATPASTPFLLTSEDDGQSWIEQSLPSLSGNSVQVLSAVAFGEDSVRVWGVTLDHSDFSSGGQVLFYEGNLMVTSVDDRSFANISDFRLEQNYPNPFNPSTTIEFSLNTPSFVTLTIFNVQGQVIKRLIDSKLSTGRHHITWDGSNHVGKKVASGIYIYNLRAGSQVVASRKMLLLQ